MWSCSSPRKKTPRKNRKPAKQKTPRILPIWGRGLGVLFRCRSIWHKCAACIRRMQYTKGLGLSQQAFFNAKMAFVSPPCEYHVRFYTHRGAIRIPFRFSNVIIYILYILFLIIVFSVIITKLIKISSLVQISYVTALLISRNISSTYILICYRSPFLTRFQQIHVI